MELEVPLGQSLAAAGCRGCGRVFTGVSGFDRHRKNFNCLHPATVGLEQRPDGKWGWPADERSAARMAHFAEGARISGPLAPAPVSSPRAA